MVEKRKQEDGARPEADRLKRDGTSDCYEPEVDRLMHPILMRFTVYITRDEASVVVPISRSSPSHRIKRVT